jgi:putative membrane protein
LVILRASLSALHILALAIGFGAIFARGRRLRDLRERQEDGRVLQRLFQADGLWGLAALLWIGTGLARAFGRLEKAPDFYLRNGFFWVKMALFLLALLLELYPMSTFIQWRVRRSRGLVPTAGAHFDRLIRFNDLVVAVVLLIPFVAALMARGAWLF